MISLRLRSYAPPQQPPGRLAANWLLASTVAVLALHVVRLPVWLTLGVACLLAWRFCIENFGWRIPGRWWRVLLTVAALVAVYRHYGTILGRDPGTGLLVTLAGMKLIEMRQARDYFIAVFLLFFLTLGGFLFSQSLATAAAAVLVTLATVLTLLLLDRPTAYGPRQLLRLLGVMTVSALPLMLVMYLLFPRIQGSLWGLPEDAFAAQTGISDEMAPGSINQLLDNDRVAFRATFTGSPPTAAQQYWRVLVLSDTDGRRWQRHHREGDGDPGLSFIPAGDGVRYEVTLEPSNKPWLVALDLPAEVPAQAASRPGFVLQAPQPVRQRRQYQLTSYPRYRTGPLTPAQRRHNLAMPRAPSGRVLGLVNRWRQLAREPGDIVQSALTYFRNEEFHYTLTPPRLGAAPLDEFLFSTRAGYCEHYASAFAMLMRLAEIPARVVIGFQGGEWNPAGDYLIVRMSDAHAWAEVWLPGHGWRRVDPTAAVAPERIDLGLDALRDLYLSGTPLRGLTTAAVQQMLAPNWLQHQWRLTRLRWDAVNNAWNRWVMAYGPESQRAFLRLLGFRTPDWTRAVATLLTTLVLLGLVIAALTLKRRNRPDPLVTLYGTFCRKLARRGLVRRPQEGPLHFQQRVIAARPELSGPVTGITGLYTALRYGQEDDAGIDDLARRVRRFSP